MSAAWDQPVPPRKPPDQIADYHAWATRIRRENGWPDPNSAGETQFARWLRYYQRRQPRYPHSPEMTATLDYLDQLGWCVCWLTGRTHYQDQEESA